MKNTLFVVAILLLPSAALFFFQQLRESSPPVAVTHLTTPAGPGAGQPNLWTADNSATFLSWLEPDDEGGHRLRFSRLGRRGWEPASTIAAGRQWFVNWADFPAFATFGDSGAAAHWLKISGQRSYDYDIQLALSNDRGATWRPPIVPHRDGLAAEHGFVSMLPWQDKLGLVWLDGRLSAEIEGTVRGAMTLRFATVDAAGNLDSEAVLDDRVCDCCQTSAAATEDRLFVAYRDRSEEEIRDISVVVFSDGQWGDPVTVAPDQWQIGGCPVNGPAIVANSQTVAVAWFTQAEGEPMVQLAFSRDRGQSFETPIRVDSGETMGRVDAVQLTDGSVIVSWLEFSGEEDVEIRVRRITQDGRKSADAVIARSSSSRSSGFPRMSVLGQNVVIAWTELEEEKRVRSAILRPDVLFAEMPPTETRRR